MWNGKIWNGIFKIELVFGFCNKEIAYGHWRLQNSYFDGYDEEFEMCWMEVYHKNKGEAKTEKKKKMIFLVE